MQRARAPAPARPSAELADPPRRPLGRRSRTVIRPCPKTRRGPKPARPDDNQTPAGRARRPSGSAAGCAPAATQPRRTPSAGCYYKTACGHRIAGPPGGRRQTRGPPAPPLRTARGPARRPPNGHSVHPPAPARAGQPLLLYPRTAHTLPPNPRTYPLLPLLEPPSPHQRLRGPLVALHARPSRAAPARTLARRAAPRPTAAPVATPRLLRTDAGPPLSHTNAPAVGAGATAGRRGPRAPGGESALRPPQNARRRRRGASWHTASHQPDPRTLHTYRTRRARARYQIPAAPLHARIASRRRTPSRHNPYLC